MTKKTIYYNPETGCPVFDKKQIKAMKKAEKQAIKSYKKMDKRLKKELKKELKEERKLTDKQKKIIKIAAISVGAAVAIVAGYFVATNLAAAGTAKVAIKEVEEVSKVTVKKATTKTVEHIAEKKTTEEGFYWAKILVKQADGRDGYRWLKFKIGEPGIKGSCGRTVYSGLKEVNYALRDNGCPFPKKVAVLHQM